MRFLFLLAICAAAVAWRPCGVALRRWGAGLAVAVGMGVAPTAPVLAAVGEGDLPEGALAFQKLIKYQKDWGILSDSLNKRLGSIDEKEVTGIKLILKQLANEYYDMELLSKSITDPVKAKQAVDLAMDFRKQMRANDDAASAGNLQKVVDSYPATAKELADFFDLLSDVPDEL